MNKTEQVLLTSGARDVHEVLSMTSRPMTTMEIKIMCQCNAAAVYRQIERGLKAKTLQEYILDFQPFYKRKVRLIGLMVESFDIRWQRTTEKK